MASLDHFREMDEGSFLGSLLQKKKAREPQKQEWEPKEESHTLIEVFSGLNLAPKSTLI